LTSVQNDSIIILYRKNAADDWKEVDKYTKIKLGTKAGQFTVDTLRFGEYAFANKQGGTVLEIKSESVANPSVKLYPNPASHAVTIKLNNIQITGAETIEIKNIEGKTVANLPVTTNDFTLDCSTYAKGTYIAGVYRAKKLLVSSKLIIQ
jgi:hypothetical protein